MRHLMPYDALEFDPVELSHQTCGHADHCTGRIASGREGIRRGIVNHVDAGRREARGDCESLNGVDEVRVFFLGSRAGA